MKRIMRICCMLLLIALLLPLAVQADVIYEPFDSFYEQHRRECTYVSRNYTASGPNGNVTLYESPLDPKEEKIYDNGTVLSVSYSYEAVNGVIWACCDNWEDGTTGWVPMEYLELIYDGKSFAEEYGDKFVALEMQLDVSIPEGESIRFWEYPGSKDYIEGPVGFDRGPSLHTGYTDDYGYEWGQCGYFMGIKGMWINLSNPTADYETLYPDMPEETLPPETEVLATESVEEIKPAGNNEKLIVTLAVAAVVAVSAVMLVMLKKKK